MKVKRSFFEVFPPEGGFSTQWYSCITILFPWFFYCKIEIPFTKREYKSLDDFINAHPDEYAEKLKYFS